MVPLKVRQRRGLYMTTDTEKIFISYARGDDGDQFDPRTSFVARLWHDLSERGFDVWVDRVRMPSRGLTFGQEIRDAIVANDRVLLVIGPYGALSDYVRSEWQFAWRDAEKVVTPVLRAGDYDLLPAELRLLHCEDFRSDSSYCVHFENLLRQLHEPLPHLGNLIDVPSLPLNYLLREDSTAQLCAAVRADVANPSGVRRTSAAIGLHGMGGVGKSVLASAIARDRTVREVFTDGVAWVGLGRAPDVRGLLEHLYIQFGGNQAVPTVRDGGAFLANLLRDRLVLLILDNVWERDHVEAFNVLGPRSRLLITTQDLGLLRAVGSTSQAVELFNGEEALRLLAAAAGIPIENLPAEARLVLEESGRLPLALALAGGLVRRGLQWRGVLDQIRSARLERIGERHPAEDHHASIWRTIDVSVAALPANERSRFLEVAVFPTGELVPEAAVKTLWSANGQTRFLGD